MWREVRGGRPLSRRRLLAAGAVAGGVTAAAVTVAAVTVAAGGNGSPGGADDVGGAGAGGVRGAGAGGVRGDGDGDGDGDRGGLAGPVLGLRFPAGFGWGAATSAYQIEGATRDDGRGESIWDAFARTPGRVRNGDTGDVAADHYHRYAQDLDLMKDLGLRSYRFSIAWPRIQPTGRGEPNRKGIDFYRRLIDGLHQRGIAPMATLFHWDLPLALQEGGGWGNRDTVKWFGDYAYLMFRALSDSVPVWLTINEPKTIVTAGHVFGTHAPGQRDPAAATVVTHHLLLAHGTAVQAYRAAEGRQRIGPALNLNPVYPLVDGVPPGPSVVRADVQENRLYLDPILTGTYPPDAFARDAPVHQAIRDGDLKVISAPSDILAVQYYNPVFVDEKGRYGNRLPTSQAGWQQIYPQGLYDLLVRIKRDYGEIPLTITENGIPVPDTLVGDRVPDPKRIDFLREHLAQAHRAISDGVRLESYHVWSLLDNFEWAEGYSQRWGIVYVDYASQRRVHKDSARWYRDVIARGGI